VASGKNDHVQVLIDKGCITSFVQLLSSSSNEVIEQAIWGLGNIAGDNPNIRDLVISAGAVNPIANLLNKGISNT